MNEPKKPSDGGPAFPVSWEEQGAMVAEPGMSLADRIAIQMAPGLLRMAHETAMLAAQSGNAEAFEKANKALDQNLVSASAYDFAEAMLAEREKRRKQ